MEYLLTQAGQTTTVSLTELRTCLSPGVSAQVEECGPLGLRRRLTDEDLRELIDCPTCQTEIYRIKDDPNRKFYTRQQLGHMWNTGQLTLQDSVILPATQEHITGDALVSFIEAKPHEQLAPTEIKFRGQFDVAEYKLILLINTKHRAVRRMATLGVVCGLTGGCAALLAGAMGKISLTDCMAGFALGLLLATVAAMLHLLALGIDALLDIGGRVRT